MTHYENIRLVGQSTVGISKPKFETFFSTITMINNYKYINGKQFNEKGSQRIE